MMIQNVKEYVLGLEFFFQSKLKTISFNLSVFFSPKKIIWKKNLSFSM